MADKDVLQKKSDVNYGEIAVVIIALLAFAYIGSGKLSIKTENSSITCEKKQQDSQLRKNGCHTKGETSWTVCSVANPFIESFFCIAHNCCLRISTKYVLLFCYSIVG